MKAKPNVTCNLDRNMTIEREFSEIYYDALKGNEGVSVMSIYRTLAIKHRRSHMTIRRIIRGYKNKHNNQIIFPVSVEKRVKRIRLH